MERPKQKRGFSLVELVIVIVIIGVIAAIAVPRISRGAAGAGTSAIIGDLHVLRQAIDLYAAEHDGEYPPELTFEQVMTQYTDLAHDPSPAKDSTHVFGPYLVKVPKLKVGSGTSNGKGKNGVSSTPGSTVGWVYDATTGKINANSVDAEDDDAVKYDTY